MSDPVVFADQLSAGAMLRQAREASGLHIAALAVALKVPVKKLEALEADRIDLLPDAVFARALAASVCRTLKCDAGPILAKFPAIDANRLLPIAMGENASFSSSERGLRETVWAQLSKPTGMVVAALALGMLAIALYPAADQALKTDTNPRTATAAVVQGGVQSGTPIASAEIRAGNAGTALSMPDSLASGSQGLDRVPEKASEKVADPVVATPAAVSADNSKLVVAPGSGPAASPLGSAEPVGVLVVKTRGTSWVEVTDAGGVVQLRKTMAVGEAVNVSGALPMRVVVGRADTADVQIRGKPLDLAPVTKDNVARFEVK